MRLQLLSNDGRVVREWDTDVFGDLNNPQNGADLVAAIRVNLHRARQSERLPDLVPPGPTYRLSMTVSTPTAKPRAFAPGCSVCDYRIEHNQGGPSHDGVKHCESGSIASGGTHAHCSCEACY